MHSTDTFESFTMVQNHKAYGIVAKTGKLVAINSNVEAVYHTENLKPEQKVLESVLFCNGDVVIHRTDSQEEANKFFFTCNDEEVPPSTKAEIIANFCRPGFVAMQERVAVNWIRPEQLVSKVEYGWLDNSETVWKYDSTELQLGIEFLNTCMKKTKFKKLKTKMI